MIKSTANNIPVLEGLRAFATLSVCLYHFVCTTTGFVSNSLVLDFFSFGKYGVQMFFVVSGFIIPWSMYKAGYTISRILTFLKKRFIRLEPPYIVSICILLIVIIARQLILKNNDQDFTWPQVFLHIGYLIPFFDQYKWLNQVYWTLAIEFQYYLMMAVLFPFLIHQNRVVTYVTLTSLVSLSLVVKGNYLPHWLIIFLIGITLFLFVIKKINKYEFLFLESLLVVLGVFHYGINPIVFSIIPVIIILKWNQLEFRPINALGKISYSVYLIHPIIGASVINVLSHHVHSPLLKATLILFGTLVTLFSSYIMYRFVEKPSKKWSSNLKY